MWFTLAYIERGTRRDDVEFYLDKTPRSSEELYSVMTEITKAAAHDAVLLLEFSVHDEDGNEVWRGLL